MKTREDWYVAIDHPGPPRRVFQSSRKQAHYLARGLRRLSKRAVARVVHRIVRTYSREEAARRQAVIEAATYYAQSCGTAAVLDAAESLRMAVAALES